MKFLVVVFLTFFTVSLFAQDAGHFIKEAIVAEQLPNEGLALYKYKEALKIQPTNVEALSKAAELCCRIGSREKEEKKRDAWFSAALQYANKAVLLSPTSDVANVSKAMALGKSSMTKSGKEKIKNAKEIKKLIDVAIATNPSNYLAWHILGRWNYEISNISSVERTAAKIFLGTIPEGSLSVAISSFEKSRSLSKNFMLNNIELAKAYHQNDENKKALALLQEAQRLPIGTEDDPQLKKTATDFYNKWK